MKTKSLALLLALCAAFLGLAPRGARADVGVSFQFFYDSLSPYGEWVEIDGYGDCWAPTGVDADWSPYTDGYWSYTDAGWTWVSYEDWGGICYHYGRWLRTDDVGWCWVPDEEWGPAWVSWRSNDDYIGWAPLPPEARWRPSIGFSVWCDDAYDIGPGYYSFCSVIDFGAPLIRTVCLPRYRNVEIVYNTVNITNITYNNYNNVVFCGGPNYTVVNRRARRPVPALKLVRNTNITNINIDNGGRGGRGRGNFGSSLRGNTLQVSAPRISRADKAERPKISKRLAKTNVNKGWNVAKDEGEAQKVRARIKEQSKGLNANTAPAKPMKEEDLRVLPEKADADAPSPVARRKRDVNGDGIPDRKAYPPALAGDQGANRDASAEQRGKGRKEANSQGKDQAKDRNDPSVAVDDGGRREKMQRDRQAQDKPGKGGFQGNREAVEDDTPGDQRIGARDKAEKANKRDVTPDEDNGARRLEKTRDAQAGEARRQAKDKAADEDQGRAARLQQEAARDKALRQAEKQRDQSAEMEKAQRQAERQQAEKAQRQAARQEQADKAQRQAARQEQSQRAQERQQQATRDAAMQARRQQQAEAQQRAFKAERQQQLQRQQQQQLQSQRPQRQQPQRLQPAQPQPQPSFQGGGGGGGNGGGKRGGNRDLTPEERAAKKQQRGF